MSAGDAISAADPERWTVQVLGPHNGFSYESAEDAMRAAASMLAGLSTMFPRISDYEPMMRLVISPPTTVVRKSAEVGE